MSCPNCEKKTSFKKLLLTLSIVAIGIYGLKTYASGGGNEKMQMNESGRKTLDSKTKKEISSVLSANEDVHSAFFNYDAKRVEVTVNVLNKAIKAISNPEIAKLLKFSLSKLEQIKSTSAIEENNSNYHLVSMALIHIVNTYDVGNEYNAYSCPMVKKKWLQNSKKMAKVHNPYAPVMPHCGSQDTNYK